MKDKPSYTPQEIADHCRVTKRTVYNWISEGHLEADRQPDRPMRIMKEALNKIFEHKDE